MKWTGFAWLRMGISSGPKMIIQIPKDAGIF
jgi:hypothetical protein